MKKSIELTIFAYMYMYFLILKFQFGISNFIFVLVRTYFLNTAYPPILIANLLTYTAYL